MAALPVRAALRDLLSDLLGRTITVTEGAPQVLDPSDPGTAGVYRHDDGRVAAVGIVTSELALCAGAALGMIAEDQTLDATRSREALETFPEVLNILARLLNGPTTPRAALAEVVPVPGPVDAGVAAVVTDPGARLDYHVAVHGYGEGVLTLLSSR